MRHIYYIVAMLMYSLGGALHFMLTMVHFQEQHYFRAGVYGMFLISMILGMAELVFRVGGT